MDLEHSSIIHYTCINVERQLNENCKPITESVPTESSKLINETLIKFYSQIGKFENNYREKEN